MAYVEAIHCSDRYISLHQTKVYFGLCWVDMKRSNAYCISERRQEIWYVCGGVVQSRINCIGFNWNKIKIRSDRRPVYPNSKLILRINKDFHVHTPAMLSDERCSNGSRNSFASLVRSAFAKTFLHLTQIPAIQQMLWLFRLSYSLTAV